MDFWIDPLHGVPLQMPCFHLPRALVAVLRAAADGSIDIAAPIHLINRATPSAPENKRGPPSDRWRGGFPWCKTTQLNENMFLL